MNCSDARNSVTILIIEKEIDVDNEDDSAGVRPAERNWTERGAITSAGSATGQVSTGPQTGRVSDITTANRTR